MEQTSPFSVEGAGTDRVAIRVRRSASLQPRSQRIAWFVVVVGLTGMTALVALRVSMLAHAAFASFFVACAAMVWADSRRTWASIEGELSIEVAGRRIERVRGFEVVEWHRLALPRKAVLVIEPDERIDTRRMIAGTGAACRLVASPCGDETDALWDSLSSGSAPGVEVMDRAGYDLARGLAEALARTFGWTVFDRASATPERRAPRELDLSVATRTRTLAEQIAHEPAPSRPFGAAAWTDSVGLHLGLRTFGWLGLVTQVAVAVPILAFMYLLSGGNFGIPLLGLALLGFGYGSRTVVDLTPDGVSVRLVNLWLPLGQAEHLPWSRIEQVSAVLDRGAVGLRFVTDGGSVFVPTSSRKAALWAVAQVRSWLVDHAKQIR